MQNETKTQCIEHILDEFFSISGISEAAQQEVVRKWMTPIISNSLELYVMGQKLLTENPTADQTIGEFLEEHEAEAIRVSINAQKQEQFFV